MQISRADELDLLTVLHEGMHEQPPFGLFLGRLLRRVSAGAVRLLLARGEAGFELTARPNARQIITRARPVSAPDDPVPYRSLRPDRVYSFAEFPAPLDVAGRVVRTSSGDLDAWLAIRSDKDEFSARDGALLSALTPHLAIALRNYASVEHDRLQRQVADWALERLGRGWLALSATGGVVAADELAEKILREGDQLRRSAEKRLLAASPAAHQRLMEAVEAVASRPHAPPRAVRISEDPQLELLIAPLEADEADGPVIGAAVAAHIQVPAPPAADPASALGELFDLTPAVARFAWALGRSGGIAEAAAELGLSVETARSYSKALYAKLGVSGQAELGRRILTSAAVLA
jgi:hypothetical protein